MPAPRKNQAQQKRQAPCAVYTHFTCMSFCQPPQQNRLSRTSPPPQLQTPHPARHGNYPPFHAPPHAENTHSEYSWRLACLLFFTRGHGEGGYRRAANHPKNKQHPTTSALPSFRSRRQFIPRTPICQTKRQSVLWKAHTSFYVINNPPGEQPHQGVFSCSTNQNPKNTCCQPKETLQGNLFDNPLGHAGADMPPYRSIRASKYSIPAHDNPPRRSFLCPHPTQ